MVLRDDQFDPPGALLMLISMDLATDIIWLSAEWPGPNSIRSLNDFNFTIPVRTAATPGTLVYGITVEGMWETAEGAAEEWERDVFFDPESLA